MSSSTDTRLSLRLTTPMRQAVREAIGSIPAAPIVRGPARTLRRRRVRHRPNSPDKIRIVPDRVIPWLASRIAKAHFQSKSPIWPYDSGELERFIYQAPFAVQWHLRPLWDRFCWVESQSTVSVYATVLGMVRNRLVQAVEAVRACPPEGVTPQMIPQLRIDDGGSYSLQYRQEVEAELKALFDGKTDYTRVTVNLPERAIEAFTPPITLLDHTDDDQPYPLGQFKVVFYYDKVRTAPFRALHDAPVYAYGHDIYHPHVEEAGYICLGEGEVPLAECLDQGRIADAFELILAILRTYNADSPYVSLAEWDGGSTCSDCDDRITEDDTYTCDQCGREMCGNCYLTCSCCDVVLCSDCAHTDRESRSSYCRNCYAPCTHCDRIGDKETFTGGLCPDCVENYAHCESCEAFTHREEMEDGLCSDCYQEQKIPCEDCGEKFARRDMIDGLCPTCDEKVLCSECGESTHPSDLFFGKCADCAGSDEDEDESDATDDSGVGGDVATDDNPDEFELSDQRVGDFVWDDELEQWV